VSSIDGDDLTANGSQGLPFKTIQACLDYIGVPTYFVKLIILYFGPYDEKLTINQNGIFIVGPQTIYQYTNTDDAITVNGTAIIQMAALQNPPSHTNLIVNNQTTIINSVIVSGGDILNNSSDIVAINCTLLQSYCNNAGTGNIVYTCAADFGGSSPGVIGISAIGTTFPNFTVGGNPVMNAVTSQVEPSSCVVRQGNNVSSVALNGGGTATIFYPHDANSSYQMIDILLIPSPFDFFVGGDRDIILTDGTNIYTTIPAAWLQSQSNARWGDFSCPFPAFPIPLNQQTQNGASLYIQYANGTTDYANGQININVLTTKFQ
jgi:hypothetical protein